MQEPDHVPMPDEPSSDEDEWQPMLVSDSDGEGDEAAAAGALAQQFEHMYLDGFINQPPAQLPDLQWVLDDNAAVDDDDDSSGPLQVRDFPARAPSCWQIFKQLCNETVCRLAVIQPAYQG